MAARPEKQEESAGKIRVIIQFTLSQGSAMSLVVLVVASVLKVAIRSKDGWWRLIVILAACTLQWLMLRGDLTHLLPHLQRVTSVPSSRLVSAPQAGASGAPP